MDSVKYINSRQEPGLGAVCAAGRRLILKSVFVQPIKEPCQFSNHSAVERSPPNRQMYIYIYSPPLPWTPMQSST